MRLLLIVILLLILPLPLPLARVQAAGSYPPLAIRTAVGGVVTITDQQFLDAGWPTPIPRSRIRVTGRSGVVGSTDTGAGISFISLPNESRWTQESTYWLSVQDVPASRAALPERLPGPLRWEVDAHYDRHQMTGRGDGWWAGELRGNSAVTATLMLPDFIPAGTPLQITLKATQSRRGHMVGVAVDGQQLSTLTWDDAATGTQVVTLTTALPAHAAGSISIVLRQAISGDTMLVDSLTLPTVFLPAVAIPGQPLTPARVLPDDATGADMLIIAPATLQASITPLVAAHTALGRRVVLVDVQAAYDTYSGGERDGNAIRQLVRVARPRALLLVGAGTVALRQDAPNRPTLIPPYSIWLRGDGETACDTCYGRLNDGLPTAQLLPDIPVGRLPVATPDDARVVAEKTVMALLAPPSGAWRGRAVFLTDNDVQPDGTPDAAGAFTPVAQQAAAMLPIGIEVQRLYYAPERATATGSFDPDTARLRCRLFRTLDGGRTTDRDCPAVDMAQSGAALWVYIGHGSPWQWATTTPTAPTPYLWYLYDADRLRNGSRLPILLSMTCLSGDFANPVLQSNDERLLLRSGGGVVASFSSSGEGVNTGHAQMLTGALETLYRSTSDRTLGAAHMAALQALDGASPELAFAFALLGDPFVSVPFVPSSHIMLPLVGH